MLAFGKARNLRSAALDDSSLCHLYPGEASGTLRDNRLSIIDSSTCALEAVAPIQQR
jgi:hypothetical protein